MAIHAPPSLQHRHALVWSDDPALRAPKETAPKEEREAWERRLQAARETGRWDELVLPGEQPTLFFVRPIPGAVLRELGDDLNGGKIGALNLMALCFRIGIRAISNPDIEVELEPDRRYRELAKAELIDTLDAIHPGIVSELGMLLFQRAGVPSGK